MKQVLFRVFGHPIAQLISFFIILIDGEIFAAPYLWYVRYAAPEGEMFAIIGAVGIFVTLASLIIPRFGMQLWGLVFMWISLGIFFTQAHRKAAMFLFPATELTLLLFLAVSVFVVLKFTRWKSY